MRPLLSRYTGEKADKYDAKRKGTERFRREDAVFTALMEKVGVPATVLDLPVGTGRWLPWLSQCPGPIYGVDLSADMLDLARQKAGDDARVQWMQADVFDSALPQKIPVCDLVICVRFLNWLPGEAAARAFHALAGRAGKRMIVGVSLVPSPGGAKRRSWLRNPFRRKKQKPGAVPSYVHDEATVASWFAAEGFTVREKAFVHRMEDRENFFFLLERG